MQWIENFRLGNPGQEKLFAENPSELVWSDEEIKEESRNLKGDKRKCVIKTIQRISITYPNVSEAEMNKLLSIKNDRSGFKRLLVSDGFQIIDEVRISQSKTVVYLENSSRAGITIQGVWLFTDPEHTGTNYYSGGMFLESEKKITLGTPLPDTNTKVLINYSYRGWDVDIVELSVTHNAEKPLVADITITMEGV